MVVHGRVQGVFFRQECRNRAESHHVNGWVRNRPDGTVEAVFEGPAASVEAMVDWTRGGPPLAEVVRVEVTEEEPEGMPHFSVRHR